MSAWPDACGHTRPRDKFLGTVEVEGKRLDVHVYQDNALDAPTPDMHVCIRYGAEPQDYLSPGEAGDFVRRCMSGLKVPQEYMAALPLVAREISKGDQTCHW